MLVSATNRLKASDKKNPNKRFNKKPRREIIDSVFSDLDDVYIPGPSAARIVSSIRAEARL